MAIKIINQIVYDTAKATFVAPSIWGKLYVSPRGLWFFVDNGDHFTAYTPEQAYKWLYDHSRADAIKIYFPNRIQDA